MWPCVRDWPMDVSESDVILPIQSFTLSLFLPLPVDAEYPRKKFRICILTRFPGDTYAHYHVRNTPLGDGRATRRKEHGSLPCDLEGSHPGELPLGIVTLDWYMC